MNNLATVESTPNRAYESLSDRDVIAPVGSSSIVEQDVFMQLWITPVPKRNKANKKITQGRTIVLEIEGDGPVWLNAVYSRFEHLLSLLENWDSCGAKKISEDSIAQGYRVLSRLLINELTLPSIIPSNDGSIQLEWHLQNVDVEIEIPEEGMVNLFVEDRRGATVSEVEKEYSVSSDELYKIVNEALLAG